MLSAAALAQCCHVHGFQRLTRFHLVAASVSVRQEAQSCRPTAVNDENNLHTRLLQAIFEGLSGLMLTHHLVQFQPVPQVGADVPCVCIHEGFLC